MELKEEVLENLIKQLNDKLIELQNKIEILEDRVTHLSICKLSNGKFPYYDFILEYSINPSQQCKINDLFLLMSIKMKGNTLPDRYKETAGIPIDFLFCEEPIKYSDVKKSILEIWPGDDDNDNDLILMLIRAMKDQGIDVKLCEYLISQNSNNCY